MRHPMTAEARRLEEDREKTRNWKRWGPYLSERAWGTVREDYSADGDAWDYFPHDHARSRAYRWNEDGLAGISRPAPADLLRLALWNGRDPILKERLFGLTGNEGQPRRGREGVLLLPRQHADALVHEVPLQVPAGGVPVRRAGRGEPAARDAASRSSSWSTRASSTSNRYFDVVVEYAKADARRHPDPHQRDATAGRKPPRIHVLPTVWFRNTWSWDRTMRAARGSRAPGRAGGVIALDEPTYGTALALLRRRRPSCSSPRTRPTPSGCSATANAYAVRQGRYQRLRRPRRQRGGQPGRARHQGGGALRAGRRRRRDAVIGCGCG